MRQQLIFKSAIGGLAVRFDRQFVAGMVIRRFPLSGVSLTYLNSCQASA
jgi:hypothetical protein